MLPEMLSLPCLSPRTQSNQWIGQNGQGESEDKAKQTETSGKRCQRNKLQARKGRRNDYDDDGAGASDAPASATTVLCAPGLWLNLSNAGHDKDDVILLPLCPPKWKCCCCWCCCRSLPLWLPLLLLLLLLFRPSTTTTWVIIWPTVNYPVCTLRAVMSWHYPASDNTQVQKNLITRTRKKENKKKSEWNSLAWTNC